jgi:hypothetical protein
MNYFKANYFSQKTNRSWALSALVSIKAWINNSWKECVSYFYNGRNWEKKKIKFRLEDGRWIER